MTIVMNMLEQAHAMFRRIEEHRPGDARIAAFDLDGTLLMHDVGEAVLRLLIADGFLAPQAWDEYAALLARDRIAAYRRAVTLMQGLSPIVIEEATLDAIFEQYTPRRGYLPRHVRPRVNTAMRSFVALLQDRGWDVIILSASNAISVRITASVLYGVSQHRAFGVDVEYDNNLLTDRIVEPAPIGEGKAQVYRSVFGNQAPMLTAGDSLLDLPLLGLTDSVGLALWLGDPAALSSKPDAQRGIPSSICMVPADDFSDLAQQHMHIG